MEVLSDILRTLHVRGSVYFCDRLEAPWTLKFEAVPRASFHLVRRGECWITIDGETEQLGPGDLVFLGPGKAHQLSSRAPGADSGGSGCTLLLCGYCEFDGAASTPFLQLFPAMTIVREDDIHGHAWLKATLDQLSNEFTNRSPGAELVIDKLTEIVIVELIRINFGRESSNPFVQALTDKQISKALHLLHDKPEEHWTLQTLADAVGVSRAAFAKKFRELVGSPMFEYLTQLRIDRAKEMLVSSGLATAEIAYRVGYESDVAFAKTFRRMTGQTPARFRKAARDPESDSKTPGRAEA